MSHDDRTPFTALIFAIAVHGAPYGSQAADSALRFARAALAAGHRIERVFFYHDGVYTASALASGSRPTARATRSKHSRPRWWQACSSSR